VITSPWNYWRVFRYTCTVSSHTERKKVRQDGWNVKVSEFLFGRLHVQYRSRHRMHWCVLFFLSSSVLMSLEFRTHVLYIMFFFFLDERKRNDLKALSMWINIVILFLFFMFLGAFSEKNCKNWNKFRETSVWAWIFVSCFYTRAVLGIAIVEALKLLVTTALSPWTHKFVSWVHIFEENFWCLVEQTPQKSISIERPIRNRHDFFQSRNVTTYAKHPNIQ
jgi:hypothetical protein